ncbi:D-arabinono-1,4-lactone oxidase [Nocardioides terrisoli]|uniref:D-arabinono-1,4-lactone oxidase n=1 Tax=Nocardioides terrisoli TaxID=3388267 RepID=UPI00287B961E|nr:D-arabinono-1,4-lactone oxidase [Nocardioides marmorisolisilvae]
MSSWQNWSGLAIAHPAQELAPATAAEVVDAVVAARHQRLTVKMPGTGHSFTDIAVTDGLLLRPDRLRGVTAVDRDAMTVTALAGTTLHELNATLERLGLTLHNMGDIADQTIAGATSTGTHGTGGVKASLSAQVAALELVAGDGSVVRASATENPDVFAVARLGLGALGVLTSLTFEVEPVFTLEAQESPRTWDQVLGTLDRLEADNHHFEFYWFPHTDRCLVKEDNRVLDPTAPLGRVRRYVDDELLSNTVFGLVNRLGNLRPALIPRLNELSGRALSARRYSDVPHRVFTSPRRVRFREMEYAVPREVGPQALRDVRRLIDRSGWHISFPVEVRVCPADDVALSTASGRDSMYLAFHVNRQTDHAAYFSGVEDVLRGYDGRPHWGKLHTRTATDLEPAYPRWAEFQAVRDRLDPDRVFANAYLRRVLGD